MKDSEVSKAKKKSFPHSSQPPLIIEVIVREVPAISQSRSGELIRTIPVSLPRVKFLERPEIGA